MSNTNKQHAEGNMSLVGHLKEIRNRIALVAVALIVAFIVCFTFIKPFATKLLEMGQNFGFQYVYLSPSELITAYFKLSLILAVVIVSPLILAQIWGFLAPALTKREKKAIGPAFAGGLVFFFIGGAFSYVIAIPFMIQFLINYGQSDMIASAISVASYLDFMIGMVLTFGLVFEMPMLAFVLSNLGILTPEILRNLYESGARFFMWGYEAESERVMKLINKGIDLAYRKKILKDSRDAGLWNLCTFLLGYPTETAEELQSTIDMIYNHELVNTCTPSNFALKKNSILKDNTDSVGITDFTENGELHISYKYQSLTQTMEEVKSRRNAFERKYLEDTRNRLFAHSFTESDSILMYLVKYGRDYVRDYRLEYKRKI